jgi:hypothetical protein
LAEAKSKDMANFETGKLLSAILIQHFIPELYRNASRFNSCISGQPDLDKCAAITFIVPVVNIINHEAKNESTYMNQKTVTVVLLGP